MKKVCFISVYFGEIPKFFRPFLDSCSWNKEFNWLLIHDRRIPYEIPSNVQTLYMEMKDFLQKISSITGAVFTTDVKPYKICDFRPAFGEIFQEYLVDYDFWGICDTDLLLGKLSHFINDKLLDKYDKVFTMGHLSLIRNTELCNTLYRKETNNSRDFLPVFQSPVNCVYDEYQGFTEKFKDMNLRVCACKKCADIVILPHRINVVTKSVFKLIQPYNSFVRFCDDKNFRYQLFVLNKGKILKIYQKNKMIEEREYLYIHKVEFPFPRSLTADDQLIITADGYQSDDHFFIKLIHKNLSSGDFKHYNKENRIEKYKKNIYMFVRLNIRRFRKKLYPYAGEIQK